jgi:hypothetical protein
MLELYGLKLPPYDMHAKKNYRALASWIVSDERKRLF